MSRWLKILLILMLILSTTVPSHNALAEDDVKEETSPSSEPSPTSGTPTTEGQTTDESVKAASTKVLESSKAELIKVEVDKLLTPLEYKKEDIVIQFSDVTKKVENEKLFSNILLAQLQMYELLYSEEIEKDLTTTVPTYTLPESQAFGNLESIFIAYNFLNVYLDKQIEELSKQAEPNENLIQALTLAKVDTTIARTEPITADKPLIIDKIRTEMQKNLNASVALSIDPFFKYLNDGAESDNTEVLLSNDVKGSTKNLITLVKQWGDLPHIPNADGSIKLLSMVSANTAWLTALQKLIDEMTQTTGGATTGTATSVTTSPELATSILGRLGSSLFAVSRSDSADNDPNKPITGTLGWYIDESTTKKSSNEYDPGPAAKDDYLAMFAATSIYVPFLSKVGDRDYIEAYKALFNSTPEPLNNDDEKVVFPNSPLGPLDILSQVQNLKKPLYYYDDLQSLGQSTVFGSSTSDVKGPTTLLTVGDLITAITKKKELAAVTMHGVLEQSGDTWSFYNYSLNKDGDQSGSVVQQTPVENAVVVDDGSEKSEEAAEQTSATKPSSSNNSAAGIPITNKIPATKNANGGQETTRVVFEMTYNDKTPGVGLLTGAIMHNLYHDTVLKSRFKERQSEAVYIDVVGNLVLNDGTIVLPAATNPTYWAIPTSEEGGKYPVYNPYTVAFMDSYPSIYGNKSEAPSSVNEKKDSKKYILNEFHSGVSSFLVNPLSKGFKNTFAESSTGILYKPFKVDGVQEADTALVETLEGTLYVDGKDKSSANDSWYNVGSSKPVKFNNLATASGHSIFPYINQQVTDPTNQQSFNSTVNSYHSAIVIAKNMYAYILGEVESGKANVSAANGVSDGGSSSGLLREGFLFSNVAMPVLTGITNGAEFDKSNAKADLLLAGGDAGVFEKRIINALKWLSLTASNFSNILSISNADEISALGLIYSGIMEYGFYLLFLLFLAMLVLFVREGEFFAAGIKGASILGLLFVTLFVLPLVLPWLTSVTSEPLSKSTMLSTLTTRLELVDKVHTLEEAGASGLSVKLYNLSPAQAKEINKEHFIEGNYLTNKFAINNNVGMYVQGTDIRLDLYSFMRFNPLIITTKNNVNNPNEVADGVPQIYNSNHSKSVYVEGNETVLDDMEVSNDLLNFYMPYNMMQDGLVGTLNKYLTYYAPPQSIVRYPSGLVKSSYIMNSYMKSLAFLSAEPEVSQLVSSGIDESAYAHRGITKAEVDLVNAHFYPYGDVMGLQSWVDTEWADLPNYYANSIWGQNLFNTGYYSIEEGKSKRLELADKVNRKAYDIIIELSDTKGLVSDETLIKIIALYTTFTFNESIGFQGNVVYPTTATLNEVSVTDILNATVLGNSKQYMFYDTSLVSNVYYEDGFPGLISLGILLIALIVYSIALSWVYPLLIFALIFRAIFLILGNKNIMPILIFSAKLIGITLVTNLCLLLVIKFHNIWSNIHIFTLMILAVTVVFIFLVYKLIFNKKDKITNSWQHKTARGSRGRDNSYYGNNYPSDNRYYQGNNYPYDGNVYDSHGGLMEEGGAKNVGRYSNSERYR